MDVYELPYEIVKVRPFLEDFEWALEDIELVMLSISEGESAEQAVASWMHDNPDQVTEWLNYFE